MTTDRALTLPARYYRTVPAHAPTGHVEETLVLPLKQTAFVPLHVWNVGFPDGPAHPTENWIVGMPEACALGQQIVYEWIKPAADAAREAGISICHVQPLWIADRYPQSQLLREDPPELTDRRVWPPEAIPGFNQARVDSVFGAGQGTWHAAHGVDAPEIMRPQPDDYVIATSGQFDRVLRSRGIVNLIYTGFATTHCIKDSPGAMMPMRRFGYRCIVLREATLGIEFPDTFAERLQTRAALRDIEHNVGMTASAPDFIAACREAARPRTAEAVLAR